VFRRAAWATIAILGVTAIPLVGHAHDSWINKGGYRNAAGEWCCGEYDCESPEQIASTGLGWVINAVEFVPFSEASPSPDGKVWICRRPDKTPLCFRTSAEFVSNVCSERRRGWPVAAAPAYNGFRMGLPCPPRSFC
jgi:hypothetical protein